MLTMLIWWKTAIPFPQVWACFNEWDSSLSLSFDSDIYKIIVFNYHSLLSNNNQQPVSIMYRWKSLAWQSAHRTWTWDYSEPPPRMQWILPSDAWGPRIRIECGSLKQYSIYTLFVYFSIFCPKPHLFFFSQSNSWRSCSMSFGLFPVVGWWCWLAKFGACFGSPIRLDDEWWCCFRFFPALGWHLASDIVLFVSKLIALNGIRG